MNPTVLVLNIEQRTHAAAQTELYLLEFKKAVRGKVDLLTAFSVDVREHYSQYTQVYTDGSKD